MINMEPKFKVGDVVYTKAQPHILMNVVSVVDRHPHDILISCMWINLKTGEPAQVLFPQECLIKR